ncbi:MAG: Cysteine-type anaerobic sulfatase-maturating enzyme [Oscillospiraceae bacterium]|jgi:uncharacterized protein
MPPISLLIKPASSSCNLQCTYCFYRSLSESRNVACYGMMDENLLEQIVKKTLAYADGSATFAFQGGEPTLAGLDFFKKLLEFEKKYNINQVKIQNNIQTNGIAIDEHWGEFLAKNHFLIGISLDGPKEIHDANRVDNRGMGSYNRVMQTIRIFDRFHVEYNILCVVNSITARHAQKIYEFFKKNHFDYLQFIPCLDPLEEQPGQKKYSLTPEKYAYFLKTLFNLWYKDFQDGRMISIRYFDNLIGMLMGYAPESCGMSGHCQCQYVIEADGGVYPCDYYVTDEWRLGNISDNEFGDFTRTPQFKKFIQDSTYISPECTKCKWFHICRGGCRRNREPFQDGKPKLNYFCKSYQEFFEEAMPRLQKIALSLRMGR